ncbi:L,D-transpeptidase family protein [Pseudochelatococcus contaminans]|uniref:Murein L,D-transpeptidase YafK n=1 Tax=Pseudochelatococcus contaminans TaxID=1538103 RepID=A0A7W5Z6F1_9HYPH|nr:L,D-transpeptidase family protein [Pseudochelatococcus contaminans]MBB3811058.1 murein L,D-transpeptidase YafK [Pseudochelatococcus contaminans]
MFKQLILIAGVGFALAGCQEASQYASNAKARAPIPAETVALMREKGMQPSAPILIRSYKKEAELEIWKKGSDGRYALLKTYPICRWSGQLGPKKKEGDRQAPEGFYTITQASMNPNSSYYLSFDMGYPNAFDRAHGRTGSNLMVHGACSSAGCYSMTDEQVAEIYAIGREAFNGGQRRFQYQAYPFRMTPENMARHRLDPNIAFWRNLKEGSDHFETTRQEPQVSVCGKKYVFNARNSGLNPSGACPALNVDPAVSQAVAAKQQVDDAKIADLLSKGTPAIRLVYSDGGQHPVYRGGRHPEDTSVIAFSRRATPRFDASKVSRPDALAAGPREIVLHDGNSPVAQQPAVQVATAPATAAPVVARAPAAQTAQPVARPDSQPTAGTAVAEAATPSMFSRVMSFSGLLSKTENAPASAAIVTASTPAPAVATPATVTEAVPPQPQSRPVTNEPGVSGLW